jgi:S1-C subfamily serine protease
MLALARGPRIVPQSPADAQLSYAPIVARVAPAVVNVYAARSPGNRSVAVDDFFRNFLGPGFNFPRDQGQRALGQGVTSPRGSPTITWSRTPTK